MAGMKAILAILSSHPAMLLSFTVRRKRVTNG
jgi:hypothetical protein